MVCFSREEKAFQWKKLETPQLVSKLITRSALRASPVPKAFVRLGAAVPIQHGKAFRLTAPLIGSEPAEPGSVGQLKISPTFRPLSRTWAAHDSEQLTFRKYQHINVMV